MHRGRTNSNAPDDQVEMPGEAIPSLPALSGRVRVLAIVSRYHSDITGVMLGDARSALARRLGGDGFLDVIGAPGSFEIPMLASAAASGGRFDAIVALGCIIKGQTSHDEVIAHAIAGELARIASVTGVPIGLGVLNVLNIEQALARVHGEHGRKGRETMNAALDALAELRAMRSSMESRA